MNKLPIPPILGQSIPGQAGSGKAKIYTLVAGIATGLIIASLALACLMILAGPLKKGGPEAEARRADLALMRAPGAHESPSVTAENTPGDPSDPSGEALSAAAFEQRYGLRVNLVAVTAAGGLVDLRLKVLDETKARQLFQTQPAVIGLSGAGIDLQADPEQSQAQIANLHTGGLIQLMVPNAHNAVKPGGKVSLQVGPVRLEPVVVK